MGALLGIAVCPVKTVEIPEELAQSGWEIRAGSGRKLEKGTAHGSLAVPDAIETRQLDKRDQDQNAVRHVGLLALHDLCWGSDLQWLVCTSQQHAYHAHDHGHFLPNGPEWSEAALKEAIDKPHEHGDNGVGLDKEAVAGVASKLDGLTQEALVEVLSKVASSLPATDAELEEVGHFGASPCPTRGGPACERDGSEGETMPRYTYSVIRFVPNPATGEFVNVGVIAGSEELHD